MPTEHQDDRPAAATPRARTAAERLDEVREHMRHHINALGGAEQRVPVDIALAGVEALCDLLLPLSATVERLEAAEKSRTVDKPTASPPVPPSPPAAGESEDQKLVRLLRFDADMIDACRDAISKGSLYQTVRLLRNAAKRIEALSADSQELARLRARLADGVRGEAQHVALGGGVSSTFVVLDRGLPTGTPVLVLPDEPEGEG